MEIELNMVMMMMMMMMIFVEGNRDTNEVYDPCMDSKIQRSEGFSFGIALSSNESFFSNGTQLSPCDNRLPIYHGKAAVFAVFRPMVDEISLLNVSSSDLDPAAMGGYMVAFAGKKYAARSQPIFVADDTHIVTSFALVLEFDRGTLVNLHWKKFGCRECGGDQSFVCLNNQDCAVQRSKCIKQGGSLECHLSIQLTFSGTDKNLNTLNSWYELNNLRHNSLLRLFNSLTNSLLN
ncbi:uncharacterized protein LOC115715256 [Cannabis sativa]|uniref:uncharacterized protein LOC115715256 n=1 Tax=Cannabis sativa TaxID=3483 RepID=UPI0029C9C3CD|nr:uncharacterized protein LOC115715256 [Cannabis sativa]